MENLQDLFWGYKRNFLSESGMKKTSVRMTTKKNFWLPPVHNQTFLLKSSPAQCTIDFFKGNGELTGFILGLQKKFSVGVWNEKDKCEDDRKKEFLVAPVHNQTFLLKSSPAQCTIDFFKGNGTYRIYSGATKEIFCRSLE